MYLTRKLIAEAPCWQFRPWRARRPPVPDQKTCYTTGQIMSSYISRGRSCSGPQKLGYTPAQRPPRGSAVRYRPPRSGRTASLLFIKKPSPTGEHDMATTMTQALPQSHKMTGEERKVILASSLGTVFEWYDFSIYGTLATILAKQFFSGVEPAAAFIFTLLAFAAGLSVRPL